MSGDQAIRERLLEELGRQEAPPPRFAPVLRRARRLHAIRVAVVATLVGIVVLGMGVPVVLLSSLRGPGAHRPAISPSSGESSPSPSASAPAPRTKGATHEDPYDGISILTPPGWSFLQNPSGPVAPPTRFAIGSYRIQPGGQCAPTNALDALPSDGALAWVLEYGTRGTLGSDFPPRPARFSLDPSSLASYECSGRHATYMFRFQDQGRYFQVHVAFGERATRTVRDEMLAALSSLVVDRCPPAQPPVRLSAFGTLAPDSGRPGDRVSISGSTGRDEDGFWAPLDKIEVWWSRTSIGHPQETSEQHLLATVTPGTACSFSASFRVPGVSPGRYLVSVFAFGSAWFGPMGERTFAVTP